MNQKPDSSDQDAELELQLQARRPYVRPELKTLGDLTVLTQGAAGSQGDSDGFAQSSSIRVKKDVSYLDDAARDRVLQDLLSLRLAKWEYIDPAAAGHRHLGIIIEDSPDVAAVNPSKETIDLYSYASMAIAAVQVQAREIDSLKAEMAALRAELAKLKS